MENKSKEIILYKNTIIIFISKFFTQFLSILILPLVTTKLSTSEYGTFDLINTYGFLLTVFLAIQIENALFRFLIDNRGQENEIEKTISSGIFSIAIVLIIASIIYFIMGFIIKFDNYIYIYLYAISTLILNIVLQISRGLGDNFTYAKGSLIFGVLNLFLIFIYVYVAEYGLLGMMLAFIISNVIAIVYVIIKKEIYKYIKISLWEGNKSKELIKYALPLVPNNIMSWILGAADRTMLSLFVTTSSTGIYSVATKFSTLMTHIANVFNLSWTETASLNANYQDKDQFYSEQINNILKAGSTLCLLCVAVMPIIFDVIIDFQYNESYIYIPILLASSIFEILSVLLGGIYISLKKSKEIAISTFVSALINIIINMIFMKKFGIYVACFSTVIAYAILALYRFFDIKKYIKIKLDLKAMVMFFIVYILTCVCYYSDNIYLIVIDLLICVGFAICFNKNMLKLLNDATLKKFRKGKK